MKYRVVFMERTDGEGNPSENPTEYIELEAPDGVILDQVFVERIEPSGARPETGSEDDDFLSIATEVWEYDVADGRDDDFIASLQKSQMVIEYEPMDDVDLITPGGAF